MCPSQHKRETRSIVLPTRARPIRSPGGISAGNPSRALCVPLSLSLSRPVDPVPRVTTASTRWSMLISGDCATEITPHAATHAHVVVCVCIARKVRGTHPLSHTFRNRSKMIRRSFPRAFSAASAYKGLPLNGTTINPNVKSAKVCECGLSAVTTNFNSLSYAQFFQSS